MRVITTTLYAFSELSPEKQTAVLEKYYDINTEFEAWDDQTLANFKAELAEYGLHEPKIYYSGFGSQSDYLHISDCNVDVEKFLRKARIWSSFKPAHACINYQENGCCGQIKNGASSFDVDGWVYDSVGIDLVERLVKAIEIRLRAMERDMFNRLRDECNYLESPEAVRETIIVNDYHFTLDTLQLHG